MQLTERDRQIVELICRLRALRDEQVQVALFTPGARSRCQLRRTLLVRNQYLDRVPRKRVTDPAIYVLSRRSFKGNRLMREWLGEAEFRRRMVRLGSLDHLLAVNDVRVRVGRACRDLGWSLRIWQQPQDLAPLLASARLVPDGYFQIQRRANGQVRTASFFVEVERVEGQLRTASFFLEVERVGKSSQVLRSKLLRYGELYYSGRYEQLFGTRALRVLVVFAGDDQPFSLHRVEKAAEDAHRLGITIARFTDIRRLKAILPVDVLREAIWREPGNSEAVALFPRLPE